MKAQALGLIEAVGLPTAIEAADAAMKAANVTLIGYEKAKGGGWTTIKIRGDVGAVKAAVEAAVASASRVGKIRSYHVISRPHDNTELLAGMVDRGPAAEPPKAPEPPAAPTGGTLVPSEPALKKEKKPRRDKAKTTLADIEAQVVEELTEQVEAQAELEKAAVAAEIETAKEEMIALIEAETAAEVATVLVEAAVEGVELTLAEELEVVAEIEAAKEEAIEQVEVNAAIAEAAEVAEIETAEEEIIEAVEEAAADETCNLCHDPACPRRKGQPYRYCIHWTPEAQN